MVCISLLVSSTSYLATDQSTRRPVGYAVCLLSLVGVFPTFLAVCRSLLTILYFGPVMLGLCRSFLAVQHNQ
jgi:hypothetical protein